MQRLNENRRLLATWFALALVLAVGRAEIATASPSSHANPSARGPHVVWVSRTGAVRPKTELAAAKPAPRQAPNRTDRRERGDARDAHGPAAPEPVVVEHTGKDRQALPRLSDDGIVVVLLQGPPSIDGTSTRANANAAQHAAHAALFYDAHAPPRRS
jgi:hypothetical protein